MSSINNLSAVEMKITPLGVRLVATDGCRLHQVDFFADNRHAFELLAESVCDVPEYSQLSDSLTILIPSHAVDKLAAIYNGPSAVRFAVSRVDGETVCVVTYTNGQRKSREITFQASQGRFPRVELVNAPPESEAGWIESPAGFLSRMLRPSNEMTISLNGHASASNVRNMNAGFKRAFYKPERKKIEFRHGGTVEICVNGDLPADFLNTLPEETPVRLVIPNESSALQIRATIGGISALAVVMPLNTDI